MWVGFVADLYNETLKLYKYSGVVVFVFLHAGKKLLINIVEGTITPDGLPGCSSEQCCNL